MVKRVLSWLRDFEPAQLNAVKVAVVGLLAVFGVTLGTDVEAKIGAVVGGVIVLITELQAILTRFGVFAPATVERLTRKE